jgi:phosphate transport system substrate-binding protein
MTAKSVATGVLIVVLAVGMIGVVGGCGRRAQESPAVSVEPPPMPEPPMPPAATGSIKMIGSTTVLPIAEAWQKKFNEMHPEVNIAVSGGGSGGGIEALLTGTADIGNASRAIKDKEKKRAEEAGMNVVEHTVAYDGIAVVVNPSNGLDALSVEQLSDIFTGKVRNWKDVGGEAGEIQIVSRDSASGTYEAFKEMVVTLGKTDKERDYAPEALKQASNQAVVATVAQTKTAIGYIGLGYIDESLKPLKVIPMGGGDAVEPTPSTVGDGSYPVARDLYMYTNGEPTGAVKEFLDWGKSAEGQAIVDELGFVGLSS